MPITTKIKKTKSNRVVNLIVILILIVISGGAGFVIGRQSTDSLDSLDTAKLTGRELPKEFNFSLMREVWKIIGRDYVNNENIDNQEMFYSMMRGFVAGLDDPYTVFFDPSETKEFNGDIEGKFEGIGAEIAIRDGNLVVVAPLADSPAERAGVKAGDIIFAIDDEDTSEMTLNEAVKKIRGEKGTEVRLLLFRSGREPFEVKIIRDVIYIESVKYEMKEDNIGYIHIRSFNTDTDELFGAAVKDLKAKGAKAVIIDMRNNPGGLLDMAIKVSSAWLDSGQLVVSEQFGDGQKVDYQSEGEPILKDMPTVVLVNNGSASGSEIVAGALHDHQKATLVGTQTFGKGSVQNLQTLSDGSSIKITIAKWLTPSGTSISDEGVAPDVEVEYTADDAAKDIDPQLQKALEILTIN
ncbi:MAG: S41 family peptidase [Patescibacteria group bacterium]